jgi:ABC-2 type transport system permease protein
MNHKALWIAFNTIVTKEVRRFVRIWPQTLLPPAITMSLYFIIFGQLIGSRIGEMGGFSYMQFIIPGLIMMAVITNSYANVASSFYSAKFQRSIEELLVSPTPNHIILLGFIIGGTLRGLIVGVMVTLVSLFFSQLHIAHPVIMLFTVVLTAILFSIGGFINAIYANSFDDISIIPTFVLTPLTYLGGVFYSISLLPPLWQNLSLANPILYLINVFRYGVLGVSDIPPITSLLALCVLCLILYVVAYRLLKAGFAGRV